MNAAEPLRAPVGAVGWSPDAGWLYDTQEVVKRVDRDAYVLVVSNDGYLRGVTPTDRAPLVAVVRVDGDLAEVVARLDDLADRAHGLDVSEATDVNELRARVTALVHRVDRLEGGRAS